MFSNQYIHQNGYAQQPQQQQQQVQYVQLPQGLPQGQQYVIVMQQPQQQQQFYVAPQQQQQYYYQQPQQQLQQQPVVFLQHTPSPTPQAQHKDVWQPPSPGATMPTMTADANADAFAAWEAALLKCRSQSSPSFLSTNNNNNNNSSSVGVGLVRSSSLFAAVPSSVVSEEGGESIESNNNDNSVPLPKATSATSIKTPHILTAPFAAPAPLL
eukprot:PhM_4_TR13729/c0_g1_i1/m.82084